MVKSLSDRVKLLERRRFGLTQKELRLASYSYAMKCDIEHGSYIPPLAIFKGMRQRSKFTDNLPNGSVVCMSESGYINEEIFLKFLEHFQDHSVPGRLLLISDGHSSRAALSALLYCQTNDIEMLCLPPHTTHVLQPLDRCVFKALRSNYHRDATSFVHRHPGSNITKIQFNVLFNEAWKATAAVGLAVNGFFLCRNISFQARSNRGLQSCSF
ncbi:hypothetical protein PR048_018339 [Dryococelus australis]|uniref:DDE-1 domain-containing protein n=1 Tax=Dryococelus australis TaxID=614101 RepID=A0ABQ9HC27_9NEOP|nr:hypothetical protein PR048_018339 [Dryococelus australis]